MGAGRTTDKYTSYVLLIFLVIVAGNCNANRPLQQQFGNRRPFGPLAQLNSIRKNATVAEFALNIDFKYFNE